MITDIDIKKLSSVFATKEEAKKEHVLTRREIKTLTKKVNLSIKFTDEETMFLKTRVEKIEKHLDLPQVV